ncbi:MAG: pyridoxal 5'-phosphate synthase [Halofilum sp. (in: g-proteobacteria)]|nr:pyridoxal 5'-phosphate synthase [Halofilum sp. (in: g-proteobacteria)]
MALNADSAYQEAIGRLRDMIDEARARGLEEPSAASLATTDLRGQPSIRMISVVDIDDAGPLFFVDVRSGKGKQLVDNPGAALCFYWPQLQQQIVIEGHAQAASRAVSDRLWATRPREAQLAAWVGEVAPNTDTPSAGEALRDVRARFASQPVPRPPHWQAMHLFPSVMQFWKPGWRNLHWRERYVRTDRSHWRVERVQAL